MAGFLLRVFTRNRPMETSRKAKTEKSTSSSVKCEGFAHCFLRLQWRGASWILATRSIRNATLKFYTNCAKQFVRNAQNCGKTNHEFWMLSFCKKKNSNHASTPAGFFLFPKLMKGKHFATIVEIKWKSKLFAIPKSAFQKCFEDWKKRWHKCIISEGGLLWSRWLKFGCKYLLAALHRVSRMNSLKRFFISLNILR